MEQSPSPRNPLNVDLGPKPSPRPKNSDRKNGPRKTEYIQN